MHNVLNLRVPCPQKFTSMSISRSCLEDPQELAATQYCWTRADNPSSTLRVCYTAMHGVGAYWTGAAFAEFGLPPFIPTPEQIEPDPNFPTVAFPNPEEGKGALALAMATAERTGSLSFLFCFLQTLSVTRNVAVQLQTSNRKQFVLETPPQHAQLFSYLITSPSDAHEFMLIQSIGLEYRCHVDLGKRS